MALRADRIQKELTLYVETKLPAGAAAVFLVQLPGDDDLLTVSTADGDLELAEALETVAAKLRARASRRPRAEA